MNPAEIADGVREGIEQMETIDDLRQAIIANIEEVIGDPEEYDLGKVAGDLIARVRAYLIVDAELPENPYKKTFYFNYVRITEAEIAERLYEAYEKAQQDMLAAGWRKVKEEK